MTTHGHECIPIKLRAFTDSDVVDMTDVKTWTGWCDIDYCKLCERGPFSATHEFSYSLNGGPRVYVSEACSRCAREYVQHDPHFTSREKWAENVALGRNTYDHYVLHGLIDDLQLEQYRPVHARVSS